jgi:ABC-type phosphate transport system permease subunit
MRQTNEMCAIFILYFVLFLFVTCFGWNFSAIVVVVVVSVVVVLVVAAAAAAASDGWWMREATKIGVILSLYE